jgi:hypothetical protein
MAYQQKYYKEIVSQGHRWRLVILQDTEEALTPIEIGQVLQGLRLSVQGDQADIDTPIVKTSLVMTFVDAPDLEEERKCGYWEEFYTSSATEYKVELYKDGAIEWSGYITPDSFSEDLQYRGSVSITARDNIGALQDFEYSNPQPSESGMVSLFDLYNAAMDVVSCTMRSWMVASGARSNLRAYEIDIENDRITNVLFNDRAFEGKSWYEVLESALYSTGMVLRYVGGNSILLATIRDLPLYDKFYHWDVPVIDVEFCSYGHRELSPAAKSVVDNITFEIEENIADINVPDKAYSGKGTYHYSVEKAVSDTFISYDMPVSNIVNNAWGTTDINTSLFLNPFEYGLKAGYSSQKLGDLKGTDVVYIAANPFEDNYNRFVRWKELVGAGKYRFSFKVDTPVSLYDNDTKIGFTDYTMQLSRLRYYLRWKSEDGSKTYEYRESSKSWVEGVAQDSNSMYPTSEQKGFPYLLEFPELEVDKRGAFELVINGVGVYHSLNSPEGVSRGAYVQIKEMTLQDVNLENTSIPKSLKVTTKYNDKNNIRIDRKVEYGFNMGQISSPKTVTNGLYLSAGDWYRASDQWLFNAVDTPQPLSVLLHQQLLAYYSKPNNVLAGELAVDNPTFNALYRWNGKNHIITSGTLNVLSGRMENATLREFERYDYMWETWVEQEVFKVDYVSGDIQVRVHSNKALTTSHLVLPSWIDGSIADAGNGVYILTLHISQNDTGANRTRIIEVDTALVKVEQVIAGDYGIDYGFDYS